MIFTQTSEEPYTRHNYKLHYTNKKTTLFDNYQDLLETWFYTENSLLDYVEVIDKKQKPKGF